MTRSTAIIAALIAAAFLTSALPVAAAASVGEHGASSGTIAINSPSASNNYQYFASCPYGNPALGCGKLIHGGTGGYAEFQFTVTGLNGAGVDRVIVEGSGGITDGACAQILRAPDGVMRERPWDPWCSAYVILIGKLPAGTYTLRIECYCNGHAYFYAPTYLAEYAGWDATFTWETSHGLVPPRAESPQPRTCFTFHINTHYGQAWWYPNAHATIDFGDGETYRWETKLYWSWLNICHLYDVPVGVAVVCLSVSDDLGRSTTPPECQTVDRGISVS